MKNGHAKKDWVQRAIAALEDQDGRLTADGVVNVAAEPNHPLHGFFEWDDGVAGHRYRIGQARRLLARVRMEQRVDSHTIRVPAYVRDPEADPKQQGYRSTVRLKTEKQQAEEALMNEVAAISSRFDRLFYLAQGLGMEDGLKPIIEKFENWRQAFGLDKAA